LTPKTQPANKSIASKAPITGRHHPGIPSDMISESVGDIIGIRNPLFKPSNSASTEPAAHGAGLSGEVGFYAAAEA